MGVVSQPFAVDLEKMKKAFGSKDEALFEKAKQTSSFKHYSSQDKNEGDTERALRDILFTYLPPEQRKEKKSLFGLMSSQEGSGLKMKAHLYGYALIPLAQAMGIKLDEEGDIFYMGDAWEETNEYLKNIGLKVNLDRFEVSGDLFDLPKNSDWPYTNAWNKEEARYMYEELSKLLETGHVEDEVEPDVLELLTYFRDKLKICVEKNCDWLSFAH